MTFAEAKARCEGLRNRLTDNPDNIKEYNALCNVLSSKNNYNIQEVNTKKFSYRVDPRKNEERLLGGGLEDTVASIAHKIISSGIELMVHGNESKMNDCRKNGETIEATAVVGGQKYEGNYEGKSKVKLLKKMFLCCCPVYHLVATGEGKFYAKQITYTGIFLDNLFDDNTGKAELCIGNDAKYKGNFEKGKRSGPGILEMYDNKKFCWYKVYEGIWENDIYLDGIGYNPDGSTVQIKKTQTETKTNNSPEKDPLISKTEPQTSDKMIEIHMPNVVKPPAMIDENKNKLVKQNQVVPVNIGTNPTSPKPIRRLSTQDHSNLILKKLENPTLELSLEESIGLLVQCIKNGNIEADKTAGKEAVIFIGNTGAGKSTTVNYLYGCEMQLQSPKELNIKGFEYVITVKPKIAGGKLDELMPIGHTKHSKTFMPQIETDEKNGMTYMDCPGFLDNRGPEINIANAVNIKNAIKKSKSVKVMVLINYHSLKADRGRGLSDMIKITSDLFGKTSNLIANKESILIGVTNAPTDMDLEGLKEWIVEDNLESIKQLSDCIFTFDPLGRETKGGWTREQIIEKINNLKPITNHAKIFSTVLTNEDENKLLDISDKIGSKIIGQLNKSNLIVEDFKQAAKQLSYLEDLSIIDHVTVERLLLRNQNRIERKFQELKNEFNTNCSLENFDSAISLLNLLKESIKFFNSIEQINFEKLEEHLKACNDKKYKAEAKEKIYQEQLKAANNKIEDMIKLLDQQRKDTQSKLDEQQKMFAKMLTEQSESLAKEMKKYDQDRQFIEKEFEARLFKKDEEMAIAKTLNQKEVQGRIEEEKEKLNLEFDNKKKALELEKLKYQQEQKELLAQKQKKQEEENQKLQNRLKELEVAQQKKALEQEKLRLDQEKQEREILLKKQKQEEERQKLEQEKLEKARQEKLRLEQEEKELLLKKQTIYPKGCFGPTEWKEHFGEVGEAPALPADIEKILDEPCPYYQAAKLMGVEEMKKLGKSTKVVEYKYWIDKVNENKPLKVRDTHLLTLIPKTVNNAPFTLKSLGQIIRKPIKGNATSYQFFQDVGKHGDIPVENSYWVMMPKEVVPGTKGKIFDDQKKAALINSNYVLPKAIEVAVSILMYYVKTKECLFQQTYTKTIDVHEDEHRVWVGNFTISGFSVIGNFTTYDDLGYDAWGLVCLRKFLGEPKKLEKS